MRSKPTSSAVGESARADGRLAWGLSGRYAIGLSGLLVGTTLLCPAACGDSKGSGLDDDAATSVQAQPPEAESPSDGSGPTADDSSASVDGPAEDATVTAISYYDVNHVLLTGQSLSLGFAGSPALTLGSLFDNTMFVGGVNPSPDGGLKSVVPLVENQQETIASSFANLANSLAVNQVLKGYPPGSRTHSMFVSGHGVSGKNYYAIKKGANGPDSTPAYANGLAQVAAARQLSAARGKSHVVRAVLVVHGESDANDKNLYYADNLLDWQRDYEADIRATTGQVESVPLLESQISSWTSLSQHEATSNIPILQLSAHVRGGQNVILTGPKYQFPYAPDGIHLTNEGYRMLGEEYAKVYRKVVLEGGVWEPLRPKSVTRTGATVVVKMFVPAPPLVLDTETVKDPGQYGFEWVGTTTTGAPVNVIGVQLSGVDSVTVQLSDVPKPQGHLRYALRGVPYAAAGPKDGPRGNLRDSDGTPSLNGYKLYNWCVHFDETVP